MMPPRQLPTAAVPIHAAYSSSVGKLCRGAGVKGVVQGFLLPLPPHHRLGLHKRLPDLPHWEWSLPRQSPQPHSLQHSSLRSLRCPARLGRSQHGLCRPFWAALRQGWHQKCQPESCLGPCSQYCRCRGSPSKTQGEAPEVAQGQNRVAPNRPDTREMTKRWLDACRAPVQRSLPARSPPPAGVTPCTISAEPCWLYDAGSGIQMRMVSMSCNATSATELQYAAAVEFATGQSTGWLSVTPTSGVAPASASIPFM